MTRPVRIGAVLVGVYVVVAAATASWAPGRLRPLFDGFGSHPGQYNWVNPPREFAAGNQPPQDAELVIDFDATGSKQSSAGPGDGQIAASLPPGALAGHQPDTEAALRLTPLDPSTLGPLPAGLRPESNAYRVDIAYQPSGTKVVALDTPGSIGLIAAAPTDTLLYSLDGKAWDTVDGGQALTTGSNGVTGALAATGYYLAAARGAPRSLSGGAGSGGGGGKVVLLAAVGVGTLLAAGLLVGRRRPPTPARGRPAPGRPRGSRRPPSGQRAAPAKGGKGGGKGKGGRGKGGKGPTPRRR